LANLTPNETLRILLISASEALRTEIGEALKQGAGDHRFYWVSQSELVQVRAQDLLPHVVLVDENLGGADMLSLIVQLTTRLPEAAILALVENGAMNRARQAVLAGARGFVTKPLQAEDFLVTLRQILTQHRARPQEPEGTVAAKGRIVTFCAPKGGTGRTFLAINVALSLQAISGEPVVLVDADFAAPALDVAMNLTTEHNVSDLLPKMGRLDDDLITGVLASHASGVQVLLAPPPADLSSPISLPQIQQVLVRLKRMFPWVVVDLGLPLNETAFAFLDGADRIIMTVLPEMVGLRNTRLMLDALHARGYPNEKMWLVLNRATMAGGITVGDIEERLHVRVKHKIPDDQPLVTHSVNRGVPLVMNRRRGAVTRAIEQLVRILLQDMTVVKQPVEAMQKASTGLLGRLHKGARATDV
jgi:pilus assembly protein CpaE